MYCCRMKSNSHLTAITRRSLPVPTRWLIQRGYLPINPNLSVLDYGCGKCHDINNKHFICDGYDPHYRPEGITRSSYNIILCSYVLCTIPDHSEKMDILHKIKDLLTPTGTAYISVRNDRPARGWGFTSRGTYQGRSQKLPLTPFHTCTSFRMYSLTPNTNMV